MKKTYRHYISGLYDRIRVNYYEFKTFKVYWAYRWYIAKELDKKGFGVQTEQDHTGKNKIIYTNYSEKY